MNQVKFISKIKIKNYRYLELAKTYTYSVRAVVPKLFWCVDHLKYFSAPQNTQ